MADNYTRTIVFNVKDQQIRRATDRLFKSLERIEKKLDVIANKGFDKVGASIDRAGAKADRAAKKLGNFGRAVNKVDGYTRGAVAGSIALASAVDQFGKAIAKPLAEVPLLGGALTKLTAGFGLHSSAIAAAAGAFPPLTAAVAAATAGYIAFGKNGVGKVAGWLGTQTKALKTAISEIGTFESKIKVTDKALKELARGEGLSGLRKLLSEAVAEQNRLLTTNTGYITQLVKVRSLQADITNEMRARQQIDDRLARGEGITAGAGLDGLNKSLREQEAILGRMLSTEVGFTDQVAKVKSIQELITEELRQRELLMGKINIKEEKSASLAERTSKFRERAGDFAQKVRPGGRGFGFTGVERRGLRVGAAAGATMGVSGFMSAQNAIAEQVNRLSTIPMPWGKWETGIHMATQSSTGFLGVLNDLGHQLAHVQPEYLAIAAAAYMAFGVDKLPRAIKNVFNAGKATRKTTASLINFGKATVETGAFLKGLNMDFKLTSAGAKQLGTDIDTIANGMDRMNRERALASAKLQRGVSTGSGNIQQSGFGAWSAKMEQREKTRKTFADTQRRKELKWANALQAGNQRTVEIKGRQLNIEERINMVLERRRTKQAAANKGGFFKGGPRDIASSAMIGGGFPLLFGQGGTSAAGGLIGGAFGGAMGGGFGFGLSVIGTAIGQWIEQTDTFNFEIAKVNAAMETMGHKTGFTADNVKEISKALKITREEALQVLSTFSQFGAEIGNALGKFYGADTGALMAIGKIRDQQSALEGILALGKKISFEEKVQLISQLGSTTAAEMQIKLADILVNKQYENNKALIKTIGLKERIWYWTNVIANAIVSDQYGAIESPEERVARQLKELNDAMEKNKALTDAALAQIGSVEDAMANLKLPTITAEVETLSEEIKKLNDPVYQLGVVAGTIGDSFGESFKGIITGAMTAQEALANMFQRVADAFLDMAAQMIAAQVKMNLMGIFMPSMAPKKKSWVPTGGWDNFGKGFGGGKADGGSVTGGTSYLVGEKGPEIFTPGKSGGIIPNKSLGGTSNVTINVDAGGSSVQGNGEQAGQLGRMLAAAVQDEMARQKRPGGLLY